MDKSKWAAVTITAVFLAAQTAIMIALALRDRPDYLRSVLVTTGGWLAYTLWEGSRDIPTSTYVRVLMSLTIFADALFGYYFNLYETSFLFDKFLHIFGTYSFSLLAYLLVARLLARPVVRPVKFILVVCFGLSLGSLYEILEFFTDTITHPVPPSQPSLLDTDLDLVADLAGALVAALHVACGRTPGREF